MPKEIRSLILAPACALLLLTGCDWLFLQGPPDEAVVELSSGDVDKAVLVLSLNFGWAPPPDCEDTTCDPVLQVLSADTTTVDLPYSKTVKFTSTQQLLAESYPVEEIDARMGMRVVVDGQERYNQYRSLRLEDEEGNRETLYFVYTFGDDPLNPGGPSGG